MNERDREVVRAEARSERLRNERADAIPRLVNVAVALAPVLRAFALNATAAAERMAEAFGLPHPNACALCGRGEGERDHGLEHAYERPSAEVTLTRMTLRVRRERRTRLATRSARIRWRARVIQAEHDRRMREHPTEHEVTRTAEALGEHERAVLLCIRSAEPTAHLPVDEAARRALGRLELAQAVRRVTAALGATLTPLGERVAEVVARDTRTPEERLLNQFGLTSMPPRRGPAAWDAP